MKAKSEIEWTLAEEMQYKDKEPMGPQEFAYNQGWIEALEWVLNDSKEYLCEGANNETIERAQKRLYDELEFGKKSSTCHSVHEDGSA